jgi:hypothetical protein
MFDEPIKKKKNSWNFHVKKKNYQEFSPVVPVIMPAKEIFKAST